MTATIQARTPTTSQMREVLAFALATLDDLGIQPWKVETDGIAGEQRLSIYLDERDAQDTASVSASIVSRDTLT